MFSASNLSDIASPTQGAGHLDDAELNANAPSLASTPISNPDAARQRTSPIWHYCRIEDGKSMPAAWIDANGTKRWHCQHCFDKKRDKKYRKLNHQWPPSAQGAQHRDMWKIGHEARKNGHRSISCARGFVMCQKNARLQGGQTRLTRPPYASCTVVIRSFAAFLFRTLSSMLFATLSGIFARPQTIFSPGLAPQ